MKRMLVLMVLSGPMMIGTLRPVWAQQAPSPGGSNACGLGWKVTKKKTMIASLTRQMTNMVIAPSWAIATGTMGCEKHKLAGKDLPTANYVATHFDGLKHEIAAGKGDLLRGLSEMMGCSDLQTFSHALRAKYADVLLNSKASALEMFQNIKKATGTSCQA